MMLAVRTALTFHRSTPRQPIHAQMQEDRHVQIPASQNAGLFYYLGRAAPRRSRALPLLMPEYRHGLSVFGRRYFRELYARLPPAFAVVFDNYQEVPADSALREVVGAALDEIPNGGRVIVVSR